MHRVFVTDGHWRKTLAAVRSLGRRGLAVDLCESTPLCTARFSKYVHRFYRAPSPYDTESYVEFLRKQLRRGYDMLLPMEEVTCQLVAKHRDIVPPETKILLAPHEDLTRIADKKIALGIAEKLDIPTPKTYDIRHERNLRDHPLPLIIRPRTGSGTVGVVYASTYEEAEKGWLGLDDPIVQEVIADGYGLGVSVLMNDQCQPRAVFTHERLRENPPRGGPSTLARSVRRADAEEWAVELLRGIGWVGIAQVEFRVDRRDDTPRFIEVNPRYWGTLQLAVAAGVEFPYLQWRLCREGDIEPVREYRKGMVFRWILPGDILHFMRNPRRWRDLPMYARHLGGRNVTHAIWAPDDPMPVLGRFLAAPQFLRERFFGKAT